MQCSATLRFAMHLLVPRVRQTSARSSLKRPRCGRRLPSAALVAMQRFASLRSPLRGPQLRCARLQARLLRCAALRQLRRLAAACSARHRPLPLPHSPAAAASLCESGTLSAAAAALAGDGPPALRKAEPPKLYRNGSKGGHASRCNLRQLFSGDFVSAR